MTIADMNTDSKIGMEFCCGKLYDIPMKASLCTLIIVHILNIRIKGIRTNILKHSGPMAARSPPPGLFVDQG